MVLSLQEWSKLEDFTSIGLLYLDLSPIYWHTLNIQELKWALKGKAPLLIPTAGAGSKPINAYELLLKLSSGSMILLIITSELSILLENIWRRVVGNVLMYISPSNIFPNMLLAEGFQQKCQTVFGHSEH